MKNISRLICVVMSLLMLCSCSLAIPQDLTYTQIADPTLEHIISDNSIIYIPDSDVKGKVFLDPGHGFSDPGVLGPNYEEDGVCESFLVFELSKKILSVLVSQGYEVMMCREADYDIRQEKDMYKVQPEDRTKMANDWGADFFLSLHINSYEDDPSTNYLLAAYTTKSSPDDATIYPKEYVGTENEKKLMAVLDEAANSFKKSSGNKEKLWNKRVLWSAQRRQKND